MHAVTSVSYTHLPVIFEQLEIAGHYAVDILPLVDLIDAVFADEVAIKGALDSFILSLIHI